MERFLTLSQRVEREPVSEGEDVTEDLNEMTDSFLAIVPFTPEVGIAASWTNLASTAATSQIDDVKAARYEQLAMSGLINTSNFGFQYVAPTVSNDPYVEYKLQGFPTRTCSVDGLGIIPYIIAGRDSFASRLYFESMVLAARSLRGEVPKHLANNIPRYKLKHHVSREHIQGVVEEVLDFLLHGTTQGEETTGMRTQENKLEDKCAFMKAAIMGEIEAAGGSQSNYLSSWTLEDYLKMKWKLALDPNSVKLKRGALRELLGTLELTPKLGPCEFRAAAFEPTLIPGFCPSTEIIWDAKNPIERLRVVTVTVTVTVIVTVIVTVGQGPR